MIYEIDGVLHDCDVEDGAIYRRIYINKSGGYRPIGWLCLSCNALIRDGDVRNALNFDRKALPKAFKLPVSRGGVVIKFSDGDADLLEEFAAVLRDLRAKARSLRRHQKT